MKRQDGRLSVVRRLSLFLRFLVYPISVDYTIAGGLRDRLGSALVTAHYVPICPSTFIRTFHDWTCYRSCLANTVHSRSASPQSSKRPSLVSVIN